MGAQNTSQFTLKCYKSLLLRGPHNQENRPVYSWIISTSEYVTVSGLFNLQYVLLESCDFFLEDLNILI